MHSPSPVSKRKIIYALPVNFRNVGQVKNITLGNWKPFLFQLFFFKKRTFQIIHNLKVCTKKSDQKKNHAYIFLTMHAVTNFLTIFSKNIYRNSNEKQFVKMLIHITTLNSFLSQTSVYSTNLSSFVNGSDIPTASAQKNEKWKSLSGFCVKLYYVLLIHLIIHHLLSRLLQTSQHGNNVKKSHKKCNLAWTKINGFYMELY